jgi:hypothetical protein
MKLLRFTLVVLIAVITAGAQTLPDNFAGAGFGFQGTGTPQTSGWMQACHRNPDINLLGLTVPSYLCAVTDYSGIVTSARVDVDMVLFNYKWLAGGSKTGGGAALNANGVGGAYAVGGWAAADISRWLKIDGARLVGSVTWQKDNVAAATNAALPEVLRQLAARGTFRLGFGKTW